MDIDEFELGLARNAIEECFERKVGQAGEVAEVDDQGFPRKELSLIFFIYKANWQIFSESFCETCDSLNQ
jgi:hypothetical protein